MRSILIIAAGALYFLIFASQSFLQFKSNQSLSSLAEIEEKCTKSNSVKEDDVDKCLKLFTEAAEIFEGKLCFYLATRPLTTDIPDKNWRKGVCTISQSELRRLHQILVNDHNKDLLEFDTWWNQASKIIIN